MAQKFQILHSDGRVLKTCDSMKQAEYEMDDLIGASDIAQVNEKGDRVWPWDSEWEGDL